MAKEEIKKNKNISSNTELHYLSPFEEMERYFGRYFPSMRMNPFDWKLDSPAREMASSIEPKFPKMDIIKRDDAIVVKAELAGVDKKDIELTVADDSITIAASTSEETKEEKGDYYRSEIKQGSFSRTSGLPCKVNPDKAEAKFADGILEVTIPRVESVSSQTIKVE